MSNSSPPMVFAFDREGGLARANAALDLAA